MAEKPLLTIGMPIYLGGRHGGALLRRSLNSLLNQTFDNFQVIMVDNDSPDDTEAIIREVVEHDSRFIYLRNQKNMGHVYSAYRLVLACDTKYYVEFHFDSYLASTYAEKCLMALESDSQAVLAYSQCQFVDEDNNFLDLNFNQASFAQNDPAERYLSVLSAMGWCTAYHGLMRQSVAARHWIKILQSNNAAGDNELLALMALEGKLIQIDEPLFFRLKDSYQRHGAESLDERFARLYFGGQAAYPRDNPYYMPFCRWIRDHCRHVLNFDLPLEKKNELIRQTITIIMARYGRPLEYEIGRAVDLVRGGDFKRGLKDAAEAPAGRYRYLDFAFLSELALDLEYACLLIPNFPKLHQARALVRLNLGQRDEGLLALEKEIKTGPFDIQNHELLNKIKK